MAQVPENQEQQVIYLVMDENNQSQQIQFINGQPTLIMDPAAAAATSAVDVAGSDSQVLLVSEDGQLVTGNEGQVIFDEHGRVVMTTDEGHQVALETETVSVPEDGTGGELQYVIPEATASVSVTQPPQPAVSIIPNQPAKDDDGYTTIMIGGNSKVSQEPVGLKSVFVTNSAPTVSVATSTTHPILSQQLGVLSQTSVAPHQTAPKIQKTKETSSTPRSKPAMVSIIDKTKLASAALGKMTEKTQNVTTLFVTEPVVQSVTRREKVSDSGADSLVKTQTLTYEALPMTAESPATASIAETVVPKASQEEPMEVEEAPLEGQTEGAEAIEGAVTSEVVSGLEGGGDGTEEVGTEGDVDVEDSVMVDVGDGGEVVADAAAAVPQEESGMSIADDKAAEAVLETAEEKISADQKAPQEEESLLSPVLPEDVTSKSFPSENGLPECVLSGDGDEAVDVMNPQQVDSIPCEPDFIVGEQTDKSLPSDSDITQDAQLEDDNITSSSCVPAVSREATEEVGFIPDEPEVGLNSKAKELVRDLDEYRSRRIEEKSSNGADDLNVSMEASEEHDPLAESGGLIGSEGIMLGPFNYDSDDSAPDHSDLAEPRVHVVTKTDSEGAEQETVVKKTASPTKSLKKQKKKEEIKDISSGNESDNTTRRRSSRYKSPKRYSEEPIIFGDDWGTKPAPKQPTVQSEDTPKKKGRPPKKRPYYTWEEIESSDNESSDVADKSKASVSDEKKMKVVEQAEPPKKQMSVEVQEVKSTSDEDSLSSPGKRTRQAPKKRFLEQHNNKKDEITMDDSEEKKTSSEDEAKQESELQKEAPVTPSKLNRLAQKAESSQTFGTPEKEDMIKAAMELASPRVRKTPRKSEPVTDNFGFDDEEDDSKEKDVSMATDSATEAAATASSTASSVDDHRSVEKETPNLELSPSGTSTASEKSTDPKKSSESGPAKKYGINIKSMKFSVSKKSTATPESAGKVRRIFTSANKNPAGPTLHKEHYQALEKDLKVRETVLMRREQKLRALDIELDMRSSQLRVKEGRLDRLQRQLKELERNLEIRERRVKRTEHQQEVERVKRKKMEKRRSAKGAMETVVTATVPCPSPTTKHREGLFEKLANLSKVPDRSLLEQLQDESSSLVGKSPESSVSSQESVTKAADEDTEAEPPAKKARTDEDAAPTAATTDNTEVSSENVNEDKPTITEEKTDKEPKKPSSRRRSSARRGPEEQTETAVASDNKSPPTSDCDAPPPSEKPLLTSEVPTPPPDKAPPSPDKAPPSPDKAPSSPDKAPSSPDKAPPSTDKTLSSGDDKASQPSEGHVDPPVKDKAQKTSEESLPSTGDKTPQSDDSGGSSNATSRVQSSRSRRSTRTSESRISNKEDKDAEIKTPSETPSGKNASSGKSKSNNKTPASSKSSGNSSGHKASVKSKQKSKSPQPSASPKPSKGTQKTKSVSKTPPKSSNSSTKKDSPVKKPVKKVTSTNSDAKKVGSEVTVKTKKATRSSLSNLAPSKSRKK